MSLSVPDGDVRRVFERHVQTWYERSDPRWGELVEVQRRRQSKRRRKQALLGGVTSHYRRSQKKVKEFYEQTWNSAVDQVRSESVDLFEWRGQGAEARSPATPALNHLFLTRAIEALRPASVLEVGCGSGLHLFLLSALHPDVRFHGAELTAAGVREAEMIQGLDGLPEEIAAFAADPVRDREAYRRIDFRQASAAELPFEDGAFDLVYTSIALEQMEEIRDQALASVSRVARRHVVMAEPFRDYNLDGMRHDYVRSRDIFSARVDDLPRFGLNPLHVTADFPCKVALGLGLVIAEKGTPAS